MAARDAAIGLRNRKAGDVRQVRKNGTIYGKQEKNWADVAGPLTRLTRLNSPDWPTAMAVPDRGGAIGFLPPFVRFIPVAVREFRYNYGGYLVKDYERKAS